MPLRLCVLLLLISLAGHAQPPQSSSPQLKDFAARIALTTKNDERLKLIEAAPQFVTSELARLLNQQTQVLLQEGQAAMAAELSLFTAEIARRAAAPKEMADALNRVGMAYSSLSDNHKAVAYFHQSLDIKKNLTGKLSLAHTLNNLAHAYDEVGNYQSALTYLMQSLALKQELFNQTPTNIAVKTSLAITFRNVGVLHRRLNNYAFSLQNFNRSLELFETIGDQIEIARTKLHLGTVFHEQENYDAALTNYQASLKLNLAAKKVNPDLQAQALNNIGLLYQDQGKFDLALQACNESLKIREQTGNQGKIVFTKRHLATIYLAQKNYPAALQLAQEAATLAQAIDKPEIYWLARDICGQAYLALKQGEAAQLAFTDAIKTIEKLRTNAPHQDELQQRYFEDKTAPYLRLMKLMAENSRLDEALHLAEQTKARVLLDVIKNAEVPDNMLANLAETISRQQINELLATPETALLEYVVTEEKTYLFALSKSQTDAAPELKIFPLAIKKAELEKLVTQFQQQLANRQLNFKASATKLYELLLAPATAFLRETNSLIIAPDGILWKLPFQALSAPDDQYLLATHALTYAPSLSVLSKLKNRHAPQPQAANLLVFSNPKIPLAKNKHAIFAVPTSSLTNAARQADELRKLYTTQAKFFTNETATSNNFQLEAAKFSLIHLATHGVMDDQQPMNSRVWLTPGNDDEDEGWVSAKEIMKLKLHADLVILSACETGLGRIGTGEGMIGLTWAFMNAGCATTVVSQWEVRDDSTADLMIAFHRNLRNTKLPPTKSEALRQAALAVMKNEKYRHPFYWASFVMVGNGN